MSLATVSSVASDGVGDSVGVDGLLLDFLADKERRATGPHLPLMVRWLRGYVFGGKRFRPLMCHYGWQAAGGYGDTTAVTHVAASLELFHAFALIQDDVMDNSDTRRGAPTAHRTIAAHHAAHPSAEHVGASTAILLGDLALGWSYDLVHAAGLEPDVDAAVWSLLDLMRTETLTGQYLDLLATGNPDGRVEDALTICRYKTAKYTVERPLQLGAVVAGAGADVLDACTAYGIPLGIAFQLRDDLLGVFGDPDRTGKPVLDDLRDGKPTVLMAIARQRAVGDRRRRLGRLVGDPALDERGAARVRRILVETGARTAVEHLIAEHREQALRALADAPFAAEPAAALGQLAHAATSRIG